MNIFWFLAQNALRFGAIIGCSALVHHLGHNTFPDVLMMLGAPSDQITYWYSAFVAVAGFSLGIIAYYIVWFMLSITFGDKMYSKPQTQKPQFQEEFEPR